MERALHSQKVAFLTQYFPPEMGAPQSRIFELCSALHQKKWQVMVITGMPNYPQGKIFEAYKGKWNVHEWLNGIRVHRYWMYPSNSRKTLPRVLSMFSFSLMALLSIFKVRKFKPDFLITESPPLTLALTGVCLSSFTGAKHIMNVSDIWPLSAFELGALSQGRLYRQLEKLEHWLYRNSFACMGQSQEILEHVNRSGARKSILFRNGVDVGRFNPQFYQDRNHPRRIVYMGLLGVAQGILTLCKSMDFAALGYEFHIYGQGAERHEIVTFLEREGAQRGIVLHPAIGRDEVPGILCSFDLTIIPLIKPIRGAVPSKIYEALAAGLPIIFAGGGEGAELVSKYGAGWICTPSDFTEMSEILKQISSMSNETFTQMKKQARDVAAMVFDRKIQVEKLDVFLNTHLHS